MRPLYSFERDAMQNPFRLLLFALNPFVSDFCIKNNQGNAGRGVSLRTDPP
jgi:hypothetical protein